MVAQFSRSKNRERRSFRCSILPFRGYSCVFIPRKARTVFGILSRRERNLEILGRRSRRSGRRGDFIDPRCEPFGALSGGELCTGKNCNRGQDTLERLIIRLLNPVTGLVNLFPFFFPPLLPGRRTGKWRRRRLEEEEANTRANKNVSPLMGVDNSIWQIDN